MRSLVVTLPLALCLGCPGSPAPDAGGPASSSDAGDVDDDGGAPAADAGSDGGQPLDPACLDLLDALRAAFDRRDPGGPAALAVDTEACGGLVVTSDGVAPDALHRVASVTKTYVASAVVSLVGEGALSLDDEARTLLPAELGVDLPVGVTLRHLLRHESGIAEYLADTALVNEAAGDPSRAWELADLVNAGLALPVEFEPGGGWSYSNTNYLALGLILEEATGLPWPEAVHARTTAPAGLEHTFVDGYDELSSPLAAGRLQGQDATYALHPSFPASAGNMVARPTDVARWVRLRHGTDVVHSAAERALLVETVPVGTGVGYGLGTQTFDAAATGANAAGHDGSIPGYVGMAFYLLDADAGVYAVVDDSNGDPNELLIAALEALGL